MSAHKRYLGKGMRGVTIYITQDQLSYLQSKAGEKGISVSAYLRDKLTLSMGGKPKVGPSLSIQEPHYAPINTA